MTNPVARRPLSRLVADVNRDHVVLVPSTSAHFDNFFLVRWGMPEVEDCDRIKTLIPDLRERSRKPLIYVAVMPADLPRLDEHTRKLLMDLSEAVIPYCDKLIIVMEAKGFVGVTLRSVMTALTLLTRRTDTIRVVESLEAGLAAAGRGLPDNSSSLSQAIRDVGCSLPQSLSAA